MTLSNAADHVTEADRSFEERVRTLETVNDVPSEAHEVVCHDAGRAALHFARTHDVPLLLATTTSGTWRQDVLDTDADWFIRKAPYEVAFFVPSAPDRSASFQDIVVLLPRAPYGPLKARFADAITQAHEGRVRFLTAVEAGVTEEERANVQAFHDQLIDHCQSPTASEIIQVTDAVPDLVTATGDADLAIVGTTAHSRLQRLLFSNRTDLLEALPCDVLLVRPQQPRQNSPIRRLVERFVF